MVFLLIKNYCWFKNVNASFSDKAIIRKIPIIKGKLIKTINYSIFINLYYLFFFKFFGIKNN